MTDLVASTRCLADLPPIAPRWLWPHRIPKGKIVLLAGPSGSGKTFLALDIAARISTNRPFPGQLAPAVDPPPPSPDIYFAAKANATVAAAAPTPDSCLPPPKPGSVLLITPEEDLIDNIRPRLEAAQADVDKITATTESNPQQLLHCADRIEDLKLIIIDPLSFLFPNDAQSLSTRAKLAELYQYAFGRSVAMLILLPMYPGCGDPLPRIPGIHQLASFASIIFAVSPDYREENTHPNNRVFIQLKNSLSPLVPALAFNIKNSAMEWSTDPLPEQDLATILTPPRSPLGPDPVQHDRCVQWLYEYLAPQPRLQVDVADASAAAGFSYRTLRRAKAELKIQSKREKDGHWIWRVHPGILDYDNFDQMTDKILRENPLPGLDEMLKPEIRNPKTKS